MRKDLSNIERYRNTTHSLLSTEKGSRFGMFIIPYRNRELAVVVAPDLYISGKKNEWEHVSVSLPNRCPNWEEMSFIKDLFFDEEDTVVQYHPKKSQHVNIHPYCLHLWGWNGGEFPCPPSILVGPR